MPIVQITMVEGRPEEVVKRCIKQIAFAVHESLGVPVDSVRVVAITVPATHWAAGSITKDEQRAQNATSR